MTKVVKRQKRVVGNLVEINLSDGAKIYARVLADADFAFYDSRSLESMVTTEALSRPVLFIAAVMDYAVKRGRWKVVGHLPLEAPLQKNPPKFIQDKINPRQFSIYENGETRSATRDECLGLECAAVWDPEHIEERLVDHYAGRENRWLRSLRIVYRPKSLAIAKSLAALRATGAGGATEIVRRIEDNSSAACRA